MNQKSISFFFSFVLLVRTFRHSVVYVLHPFPFVLGENVLYSVCSFAIRSNILECTSRLCVCVCVLRFSLSDSRAIVSNDFRNRIKVSIAYFTTHNLRWLGVHKLSLCIALFGSATPSVGCGRRRERREPEFIGTFTSATCCCFNSQQTTVLQSQPYFLFSSKFEVSHGPKNGKHIFNFVSIFSSSLFGILCRKIGRESVSNSRQTVTAKPVVRSSLCARK